MSPKDRERQVLLIRLSLSEACHRAGTDGSGRQGDPTRTPSAQNVDPEAAAVRIGEILAQRAVTGARGTTWISVDPFGGDRPQDAKLRDIAIAGSDLYHGNAGIALFFAYLGAVTRNEGYTELARSSLRAVLEAQAATGAAANDAIGAYLGRASYSFALLHAAALWSEPVWLDVALADLATIEGLIPHDEELDILSGSAGCSIVMLRLHAATGEPRALRVARACGDHLLEKASPSSGGVGWTGTSFSRPVAGFAHGAAGIAWALLELAAATGDERYHRAALEGITFERNLLASADGDDFRTRISWCHGLPSVALARVLSASHLDDPLLPAEVEAGAEAIRGPRGPLDACLCHGVLGNAEILGISGRHLGVADWRKTAEGWAANVAQTTEALESEPFLPLHARFAGLFCGLAGLGYGLLRFSRWDELPSVLTLASPSPRTDWATRSPS
jgi:lantibiotic modifying enzyme